MAELKGVNRYDDEVVKLLRLTGADDMMLQMINIGLRAFIPQFKEKIPNFPLEEFLERIQQKMDIDSMLYQTVPMYNRYYTREEIVELIAFYETPLGHKKSREEPQIIQERVAVSQTWIEATAKKIEALEKGIGSLPLKVEFKMHENEINKLFDVMGFNFSAMASQMLETCIEDVKEQHPNIPASEITSIRDKLYKNMDIEILRNLWATVYSRHYTREDTSGLISFYETPLGHKSAQIEPRITQESLVASQAYFESLVDETMKELKAEDYY